MSFLPVFDVLIASKIFRDGIGLLPPPGLRRYVFAGSRRGGGINGSTFSRNRSDTSRDCTFAIPPPGWQMSAKQEAAWQGQRKSAIHLRISSWSLREQNGRGRWMRRTVADGRAGRRQTCRSSGFTGLGPHGGRISALVERRRTACAPAHAFRLCRSATIPR